MIIFPFPGRELCINELKRDLQYHRIPEEDQQKIVDKAWLTGVNAAKDLIAEFGNETSIKDIVKITGLSIERINKDNVAGNYRYFSEYFSGRKKIYVYSNSIKKWAKSNKLSICDAEELILAHEFYHHLECTKLGLTSKQYMVPTLKVWKFVLLRSGIRALSEIGAHGFAKTFFELRGESIICKNENELLLNKAINLTNFEYKNKVKKMNTKFFGNTH